MKFPAGPRGLFSFHLSGCLSVVRLRVRPASDRAGNHHQGNNQLGPSPVTHRVQFHLRCCPSFESPLFVWFSVPLLALLCLVGSQWEKQHPVGIFWCVPAVWLTAFAQFIFTCWRKIWVFALPLAFNPPCRMERLFNSSITRKCPPEQRRSRQGCRLRRQVI